MSTNLTPMNPELRALILAARERYDRLTPVEKISQRALQCICYVTAELIMGVQEDEGEFEKKRVRARRMLTAMLRTLDGDILDMENNWTLIQRTWSLMPPDRDTAMRKIEEALRDLRILKASD